GRALRGINGDLLGRADLVERDAAGADDGSAGLERERGQRDPPRLAFRLDRVDDAVRELLDRGGVFDARVGDAESAAEVQQRHWSAVEQALVQVEHARRRLAEAVDAEDLGSDVAMQADEFDVRELADPAHRRLALVKGETEL